MNLNPFKLGLLSIGLLASGASAQARPYRVLSAMACVLGQKGLSKIERVTRLQSLWPRPNQAFKDTSISPTLERLKERNRFVCRGALIAQTVCHAPCNSRCVRLVRYRWNGVVQQGRAHFEFFFRLLQLLGHSDHYLAGVAVGVGVATGSRPSGRHIGVEASDCKLPHLT
jgi:hypothetical protein